MNTIIGLDFGSHTASIALWHEDKNTFEVFADELGSRFIPSIVAYRGEEVIVGQAALVQQHKNPSNTFEDIRSLILNPEITTIYVPVLEKEVTVQELASHFFRNIHNQIKMQVGKAIRDCVMSIPHELDEAVKARLYESAQAGGIRIKSLVHDSVCTLMAHEIDQPGRPHANVLVVDIGWSESEASIFSTSNGLFFPISNVTSKDVGGKVLVKGLAEHCAKDFQRKTKQSCVDSNRSMMRLRAQCEESMKHLSTGQEASIDIDSLFEGIDYSVRLSRARFEDLSSIPIVHLKQLINEALAQAGGLSASDISLVLVAGGPASMPRLISTIKGLFPTATFPKSRFDASDALCIGAMFHARYLLEQNMVDAAPTAALTVATLSHSLTLSSTHDDATAAHTIFAVGSALPAHISVTASVSAGSQGYFQLSAVASSAGASTPLGEVVFENGSDAELEVNIVVNVSVDGAIDVSVEQATPGAAAATDAAAPVVLASLQIPACV